LETSNLFPGLYLRGKERITIKFPLCPSTIEVYVLCGLFYSAVSI
jgi:hypothetical protein